GSSHCSGVSAPLAPAATTSLRHGFKLPPKLLVHRFAEALGFIRLRAMQVTELYEQILKLEHPWSVREVRVNHSAQEIEIEVVCADTVWGCPQCQQRAHLHGYERRRWRHRDTCQ